ncbi:MAG: right-handed parallel beta-helix repeat-containing protein [Acidimicrobiales bacterium]
MLMTSRRGAAAGALLLLAATSHISPAAAAPAPVKCGTVITTSTTLTANVGPCPSDGLIIGADGITLDLGGKAVQGKANRTGDGVGIRVTGHNGVTLRNGRVTDFDAGVAIEGGSGNTVTGLLVKDNIGSTKRGDFGDGIAISSSSGNTISNNNVIHNGPFDGIGLFGPSSGNLLEGNVVSGNDVSFTADDGIRIEGPGAQNNTVRGNNVSASTLDGIAVFSDQGTGNLNTGNVIEQNTVTANGFGLLGARPGEGIRTFLRANQTIIQDNVVTDNAGSGILIGSGSLANQILTNTATGNARQASATSPRFDLHDLNLTPTPCDANVWSGNIYGTANQACTTG